MGGGNSLLRDKLDFVGQLVSRRRTEFRARFTGDIPIVSKWWSCVSSETTRKRKKRSEPRRQEWAAASHGVGRKPGDGKAWYQYIASLSVTPTCVGVPVSFWVVRVVPPATLTRVALHHSLWVCRPAGLKIPRAFSPINSHLLVRFEFLEVPIKLSRLLIIPTRILQQYLSCGNGIIP